MIDVRTPEELQYVGNAGAMLDGNVPYVLNDLSGYDDKLKHGVLVNYRYADGKDYQPSDEEVKKLRPATAD